MQWSQYQRDVFTESARITHDDCAVVARAGSGKTTALIESLHHVPYHKVLLCAFNKSIQKEMENRAPRHVHCRTLHSLGLRIHQMNVEASGKGKAAVVPDKAREMTTKLLDEKPQLYRAGGQARHDDYSRRVETAALVQKVAGFAKNVLAWGHDRIRGIVQNFDLQSREDDERIAKIALELMQRMADDAKRVDFDDMLWLPWVYQYGIKSGTVVPNYDVVLVDERQDVNPAQDWLIDRVRGARVISYLDPRQCIYGFRGVQREVVEGVVDAAPVNLSLPVSYRCAHSIIEKARLVVPDIEAAPDAKDGTAVFVDHDEMFDNARAGDFILSRTNAPLVKICLALLKRQVPAVIAGRDIGEALCKMLKKSKATTINGLLKYLTGWLSKECARHMPESPSRYETSQDKVACLHAIAHASSTVEEIEKKIRYMFNDAEQQDLVVCSTVHKAKGLERQRIWIISNTFGFPNPKGWQDAWTEENIWYVAVTRAKEQLYFVETDVTDIQDEPTRQVAWR